MVRATLLAAALLSAVSSDAGSPPVRPKIYGISFVRFKATDFEKSTAFYAGVLGLGHGKGSCQGVSNPCFAINAYQHVELIKAQTGDPGSFLDEIGFAVTDIKQMRQYLTSQGVRTSKISRRRNHLQVFVTEDPEHHRIAFEEGPGIVEPQRKDIRDTNPDQVSNRMLHAGFVVRDLAAENHFYLDLLGFRLYWTGGFQDAGTDWYEIQVPDGDTWIEYMLNIPATADHKELGVQNHFSLGVRKIQSAAAKLRANGLSSFDGPEIGRDGKWGLDAYDPDASRVEFMEFTPAKDPCCHPYSAPHAKP
jgi:catechol 2,3-dioxygenase-like lactoylglutathione lyase family enzyme